MELNKVYNEDNVEGMRKLPENYIDSVITDPPYGLKFMGKSWDYDVPGVTFWQECLRVAKPGATLLCFGGSRTFHRMAVNIEEAGWILKDTILWLYASGFPKATDISKQIDKSAGAEREVIGKGKSGKTAIWQEDGGMGNFDVTVPSTEEAKKWDGWKSHGLKPSFEPIIVAVKPNDGSYAENALKWGVSGLNIEECRIPYQCESDKDPRIEKNFNYGSADGKSIFGLGNQIGGVNQGRFPANVILDEEAGKMLDAQAPKTGAFAKVKSGHSGKSRGIYGDYETRGDDGATFYSDGLQGASRFFFCAKASKSERNKGCEGMQDTVSINGDKWTDMDRRESNKPTLRKNFHPTVKPLKLMEYLCKLTRTPTGGIVLDPFAGSGTTLIAAANTGRQFIGFELCKDYAEIEEKRLKYARVKNKFRSRK